MRLPPAIQSAASQLRPRRGAERADAVAVPAVGGSRRAKLAGAASRAPRGPRIQRRSAGRAGVTGLDIQPGHVAAAEVAVNGSIALRHGASLEIAADIVREGEVQDAEALTVALKKLFADGRLTKRVRLGVANQRIVVRTMELPVMADAKDLAAAVHFQAADALPMPLDGSVLDFHALDVIDTPNGQRQLVALVAARRDMVSSFLGCVRAAGLQPVGVDLSAFAMIRALHRPSTDAITGRTLYIHVDGVTNLALAHGAICSFTRLLGGGLPAMSADLAERAGIDLVRATQHVLAVRLDEEGPTHSGDLPRGAGDASADPTAEPHMATTAGMDSEPEQRSERGLPVTTEVAQADPLTELAATVVLEHVRRTAAAVRNSLDFHHGQQNELPVQSARLVGAAAALPGFAAALSAQLGLPVEPAAVAEAQPGAGGSVSAFRLTVAAGLGAVEVPQ